jgi:hypothetical protein
LTDNFGNIREGLVNFNFTDKNGGDWIRELHIAYHNADTPGLVKEVVFHSRSRSDYSEGSGDFDTMKQELSDRSKRFMFKGYIHYVARAESDWTSWSVIQPGEQDLMITVDCKGYNSCSISLFPVKTV